MIDTVKVYTSVSEEIFNEIEKLSDTTCKLNTGKKQLYYKLCNGSLEGSYGSNLHFRPIENFYNCKYCLILEGSYHKLINGYNSHNGYYNIKDVVAGLVKLFELGTNLKMPSVDKWFLARIDISYCYDLKTQENVKNYINNNRYLTYPRRKTQYFLNECVYFAGSQTTLKIYNKLAEFRKHDFNKIKKFNDFDIGNYMNVIKGFVRFECEIRKKKILELFVNNDILSISEESLDKYVKGEFMKLFKMNEDSISIVRDQNDVKNLLYSKFSECKSRRLFGFFLTCVNDGINNVKEQYSSSSFYRNISELKDAGIDFTQQAFVVKEINLSDKFIDFTPFKENLLYSEVV